MITCLGKVRQPLRHAASHKIPLCSQIISLNENFEDENGLPLSLPRHLFTRVPYLISSSVWHTSNHSMSFDHRHLMADRILSICNDILLDCLFSALLRNCHLDVYTLFAYICLIMIVFVCFDPTDWFVFVVCKCIRSRWFHSSREGAGRMVGEGQREFHSCFFHPSPPAISISLYLYLHNSLSLHLYLHTYIYIYIYMYIYIISLVSIYISTPPYHPTPIKSSVISYPLFHIYVLRWDIHHLRSFWIAIVLLYSGGWLCFHDDGPSNIFCWPGAH